MSKKLEPNAYKNNVTNANDPAIIQKAGQGKMVHQEALWSIFGCIRSVRIMSEYLDAPTKQWSVRSGTLQTAVEEKGHGLCSVDTIWKFVPT